MFLFEELSSLAVPRSLGAAPALRMPFPVSLPVCLRWLRRLHPGRKDAERVTAGTLKASAGRGLRGGAAPPAGTEAFVLREV